LKLLSRINFHLTNCRPPDGSALCPAPPEPLPCYATGPRLGTSAPIERRICSILNNTRSGNRSRKLEQNVTALITGKIYTVFSSCDFYEKIKSNKYFLKKVLLTEKYDWPNM